MNNHRFIKVAEEYYSSRIRRIDTPEHDLLKETIFKEMDEYKRKNPDTPMPLLRSMLYENIAEKFAPVIFPECPFAFEMGIRPSKGWGEIALWGADMDAIGASVTVSHIREMSHPSKLEREPGYLGIATGQVFDTDHHCIGYTTLFEKGILGIIADAEKSLEKFHTESEEYFYNVSVIRSLNALLKIAQRFKETAEQLKLSSADDKEKRDYERIIDALSVVPANPPETFLQGLAILMFMYEVQFSLEGTRISVLGHIDRLLGSLYEQDIKKGNITEEVAIEILEKWLFIPDIKCVAKDSSWPDISCCIELGGCDEDGNPVFNELTKLVLKLHTKHKLINPKLNCRISSDSPDEYFMLLAESQLAGHNTIALLNDDVIIPALVSTGKDIRDARRYVNGGCQETITEGCEHPAGVAFYFNLPRILDLSLNGEDFSRFAEETVSALPDVIENADTFEEFYEKYFINMKRILLRLTADRIPFAKRWLKSRPAPILSATFKGCIESGKDFSAGGAAYNPSTICAYGFANLTDSLFAIKKAIYDDKIISLEKLKKALLSDWKGYEELQKMLREYSKFGHGIKEADEFAGKVLQDINEYVMTLKNERGGNFVLSTFTHTNYLFGAPYVRATADGRNEGDVLSQSVAPGRIQRAASITDAIKSLGALGLDKCGGISVLDVMLPTGEKMTPNILAALFKAFTLSGGQTLQPNFVTVEDMVAAQINPEEYKNLMVRICGFSVYFVNVDREIQNDMIRRNRYES